MITSVAHAANVSRALFTTDILDREPVDRIDTLPLDSRQINFFTELNDLQGHSVIHQWIHDDRIMFEIAFDVGGPRWRVWSSKTLQPDWAGVWIVRTLDEEGNTLDSQSFLYQ